VVAEGLCGEVESFAGRRHEERPVRVLIVGAGQNGGQVYHILKLDRRVEMVGFLDDAPGKRGEAAYGLPVFGGAAEARRVADRESVRGAIVGIGNNEIRARLTATLEASGLDIVSAIHPHTFIDETVRIGSGAIVEAGVMIHSAATVGRCVFVGGSTVISHDSVIGDYVLLGGGVVFGGDVVVGDLTTLGVGTVLQPHIRIGRNVTTGIGTVVVKDLPDNAVAVGVPAKIIRYNEPVTDY
jgi:acetyltransferase EpsM